MVSIFGNFFHSLSEIFFSIFYILRVLLGILIVLGRLCLILFEAAPPINKVIMSIQGIQKMYMCQRSIQIIAYPTAFVGITYRDAKQSELAF